MQLNIFKLQSSIRLCWNVAFLLLAIAPQFFPWFMRSDQTKSLLDLTDSHSWLDAGFMTSYHIVVILAAVWIFYSASMYRTQLKSSLVLEFFSAPFFAPFSRICFCVQLVHVPLTWYSIHSARYPEVRNEFGTVSFNSQFPDQ